MSPVIVVGTKTEIELFDPLLFYMFYYITLFWFREKKNLIKKLRKLKLNPHILSFMGVRMVYIFFFADYLQ